jgi:hypothetical protein
MTGAEMAGAGQDRGFFARASDRIGPLTVGFFVLVTMASGGTGLTLLVWPGSTETFFSWPLNPIAASALIGGLYLASSVLFGWATTRSWAEARSLCVGVYGLTMPTLLSTIVHDELFDASRWQAWAWWILFLAAPPAITVVLWVNRQRPIGATTPLPSWARAAFAGVALVMGVLAVLVLFDPTRTELSAGSPTGGLIGLTGAYLGAWCGFVAVQAGWAAWRGTQQEALVPAAALALAGAGAVVAALRTFSELNDDAVLLYLLLLGVGIGLGVSLTSGAARRTSTSA